MHGKFGLCTSQGVITCHRNKEMMIMNHASSPYNVALEVDVVHNEVITMNRNFLLECYLKGMPLGLAKVLSHVTQTKYRDELRSECLDGPCLIVIGKFWRDFFEFKMLTI